MKRKALVLAVMAGIAVPCRALAAEDGKSFSATESTAARRSSR